MTHKKKNVISIILVNSEQNMEKHRKSSTDSPVRKMQFWPRETSQEWLDTVIRTVSVTGAIVALCQYRPMLSALVSAELTLPVCVHATGAEICVRMCMWIKPIWSHPVVKSWQHTHKAHNLPAFLILIFYHFPQTLHYGCGTPGSPLSMAL